ncbi:tyrosine-type recombinase/integrase [Priestia taiwanensis]|uniref:Site-specific integrase n=1 Tax=Priestia taiwanensis TaxID=1347902 RepID=A0A917AM93_9BACI|nr:site-specific integrase [Priestia taiwanensis]MBM7361953.1 integrase [Priestia taiwanensis]GGE58320.1 site-specific integrase [Priestia taiwanensis]
MKGYFRKRGDTWSFTIDIGMDDLTGKRKQKTKTGFKTKKEAQKAAAAMIIELEKGIYFDDKNLTILDVFTKMKPIRKSHLKKTSFEKENSIIKLHILSRFGQRRLKDIKPFMIETYYSELQDKGLSTGTISNIHNCFRAIFKCAVEWEIVHTNILSKVKKPRDTQVKMNTWTVEECNRFLDYLQKKKNKKYYIFFLLAIYTGMRRGELLGLTWKDINFENKKILITKALTKTDNGLAVDSPKTKSSNRSINISAFVVKEIQKYHLDQKKLFLRFGLKITEDSFVFSGATPRSPLHLDAPHHFLKINYKQAGVPRIRIHDLRHTHATLMLEAGEHPKIVQDRLGHSSIQMTLDKYSHVTENMQQKAAENFENIINSTHKIQ